MSYFTELKFSPDYCTEERDEAFAVLTNNDKIYLYAETEKKNQKTWEMIVDISNQMLKMFPEKDENTSFSDHRKNFSAVQFIWVKLFLFNFFLIYLFF